MRLYNVGWLLSRGSLSFRNHYRKALPMPYHMSSALHDKVPRPAQSVQRSSRMRYETIFNFLENSLRFVTNVTIRENEKSI